MKNTLKLPGFILILSCSGLLLSSFFKEEKTAEKQKVKLPYKQAGLTERQAADPVGVCTTLKSRMEIFMRPP